MLNALPNNAFVRTIGRVLISLSLMLVIGSCQSLFHGQQKEQAVIPIFWPDQQKQLQERKAWNLKAKFGFSFPYQEKTKLVSANIDWKKHDGNFDMTLSGPLGLGEVTIEKTPQQTTLTNNKGQVYIASSPERLFYQHTGMKIPWSDLEWWVLGVPAPHKAYQLHFAKGKDMASLPEGLSQSGWTVSYLNYQAWGGLMLPQKIKFSQGELKATLIIRHWEFD